MRSIYILLTRSGTLLSQLIAITTGAAHTPVSISLEPDIVDFYSFARRRARLPLPAGLVRERLSEGYWSRHPGIPCTLLALPVDDTVYTRIKRRLARMNEHAADYHYSLLGVLLCGADIVHRRPDHYFCSQFVGELLAASGAVTLPRDTSLLHPDDFLALPHAEICFTGTLSELAAAVDPHGPIPVLTAGREVHP